MPLASLFKRSKAGPAEPARTPAAEDDGPVQQARVRARRRLIGAVVLMGLGVVLFPLLFETQPRPLPRDIPIEVARKAAEPSTASTQPPASPVKPESSLADRETLEPAASPASPSPGAAPASTAGADAASVVAQAAPAAAALAAAAQASAPSKAATKASEPKPASAPAQAPAKPTARPTAEAPSPKASAATPKASTPAAAPTTTAAAASAPGPGRFVVQVGALTDPAAIRDARQRLEKLGLKTYTQEVSTPAGKRTRVRAGPFATREEADRAGARIKAAGLPAYMLAL